MSASTVDDVIGAFVAAWPATGIFAGCKLYFARRSPGDPSTRYATITATESAPVIVESDGMAQGQFDVDLRIWTSENPAPTLSYQQALAALYDGTTKNPSAGLTIATPGVGITLCQVQPSALELSPDLRAGIDVQIARRKWRVFTTAMQ